MHPQASPGAPLESPMQTEITTTDIRQEIRDFVVKSFLFGQDQDLKENASFLDAGIVDSTGVLELVAHLEERYGIKVADDELIPDNLDSIDAIATFIERKRRANV
jgi:acyl carrier protein